MSTEENILKTGAERVNLLIIITRKKDLCYFNQTHLNVYLKFVSHGSCEHTRSALASLAAFVSESVVMVVV